MRAANYGLDLSVYSQLPPADEARNLADFCDAVEQELPKRGTTMAEFLSFVFGRKSRGAPNVVEFRRRREF